VAVLTYIDTGVLIWAARGAGVSSELALSFLNDPLREYVTSDYLLLELLPHCEYCGRTEESEFYRAFFDSATHRMPSSDALIEYALQEACKTGITGMDALHVACAALAGATEFITTEKSTKPMHRTTLLRVISINP
jgi:PIN domain